METIVSRKEGQARESLHRRALSQASTASSMMHSPRTTNSTSTSSSHTRAITPSNATHPHKSHHGQYDRETASTRPLPQLPSEPSIESRRPMTPVSSLLYERLQQERRAESERLANKSGFDLSSSTGDIRDGGFSSSYNRRYKSEIDRPPNSSHDDDSNQNSMGVKQMEKAISTLHKQNFDLKLELFHRREKQSTLEVRVEELEARRQELTEVQNNLLGELVKRDKAIEEAVNMIVKLETRLDDLVREKELVGQYKEDGFQPRPLPDIPDSPRAETPKPSDNSVLLSIEPKTLERMPSFLSERSTHTQHLRSVVLQNYSSPAYIRGVSEVSASTAEFSEANRIASPSLSVLSESSFLSIYGSKQGQDGTGLLPPDHVSGMDGTFGDRSPTPTNRTIMASVPAPGSNQQSTVPLRAPNSTSGAVTTLSDPAMPASVVPRNGTPLQPTERLGVKVNTRDNTSRPPTSGRGRNSVVTAAEIAGPQSKLRNTLDKRELLQKVMTNYPTHKELANVHALPPTPDTASSSVLRKHKDLSSSQDSLLASNDARVPRFLAAQLPSGTEYLRSLANQDAHSGTNKQKTRSSATTRNHTLLPTPGFMNSGRDPLSDLSPLARSAAQNTATQRPRSNSIGSDSDSDGGADARSDIESYDYWMRESYKPDKENTRSKAHQERRRSPSPDLFSFPVDSGGWQPDAMFGALNGGGFLGSPVPALKRDPNDEFAAALQSPLPGAPGCPANGPNPPLRGSSLQPQSVSQFPPPPPTGKTGRDRPQEGNVSEARARGRSNSIDGSGHRVPSGNRVDAASPSKRSPYPPISGLQSRARGLALNSFFRRSGPDSYGAPRSTMDSTYPTPAPQRSPSISLAHSRYLKRPSGRSSVPPPATTPWTTRPMHVVEDELASATPPPIMRNRPAPLETDLAVPNEKASNTPTAIETGEGAVTSPTMPEATTPVAPQSGGGMRKWLGIGRRTSLKNRAG